MVKNVTFVSFRGGRSPQSPPLDPPLIVTKQRHFMNICLNSWAKPGIRVCDHPNQHVWLHHCSKSVKHIWNHVILQVALTSTSNCIREEEGKYIGQINCINWYQMFATNISNSSQYTTIVFPCLQATEVVNDFSQVSISVTSDSNARPPDTAELRWIAVLSFLYCLTNNIIIVLLLYW